MVDEENLQPMIFGTPLNPIDEDDNVRPKPIAIHEQVVTDDKGRRRFHGAFTGGFSAGYFNSVGSRDGWTPKTFTSLRSSKVDPGKSTSGASSFQQRYEDFMDDEDMSDFGIAPKKLQASSNFYEKNRTTNYQKPHGSQDDFEKRNSRLGQISEIFRGSDQQQKSSIPFGQPVLEQLFVPVRETIGVRLLREMGWKPGQGIGPRVTRRSKIMQKKANKKMYDNFKPNKNKHESSDEEDKSDELIVKYRDFLFAPDDISSDLTKKAKDNLFGIAYKGLNRNELSSTEHFNLFTPVLTISEGNRADAYSKLHKKIPKPSKQIVGQAFGVGVYEVEDEDIYANEDVNRYDFYLDNSERGENSQGCTKRPSRWQERLESNPSLPGFVQAKIKTTMHPPTKFPPPELPKNYHPRPVKRSRFEKTDKITLHNEDKPEKNISRCGTTISDGIKRSPNSKYNEERTKGSPPIDVQNSNQTTTKSLQELCTLVESIQNQHLATSLIKSGSIETAHSFKPYLNDPPKQKRYEQYIMCLKNGRRDALPLLQPKDMTEWERNREQTEFDRAAVLYHNSDAPNKGSAKSTPGASFMSSRFVSAKANEELDVGKDENIFEKQQKVTLTEAEKAAELKCFGKLTRETVEWHPARILCIRFNVKEPYGDSSIIGVPSGYRCKLDIFKNLDNAGRVKKSNEESATVLEPENLNKNEVPSTISDTNSKNKPVFVNNESEEIFKKASNDLFKAIFLDSEDSDESDIDENSEIQIKSSGGETKVNPPLFLENVNKLSNIQTKQIIPDHVVVEVEHTTTDTSKQQKSQTQPKGLFANIDFSTFQKKKNGSNIQVENENSVIIGPSRKRPVALDFIKGEIDSSDVSLDEDIDKFGPKKPKTLVPSSEAKQFSKAVSDKEDSDEWMEKSNKKQKKHKHLKSKKKKDKKSKYKKDKKRKHQTTDRYKQRKKSKHHNRDIKKKRNKRRKYTSSESSTSTSESSTSTSQASSTNSSS